MDFNEVEDFEMEVMKDEKKPTLFGSIKKVFTKKEEDFTAELAWLESTYGIGANMSAEERVANKQKDIMRTIKSKFRCTTQEYYSSNPSYHCVIDIEEDLAAFKELILQPFVDKGFTVINLSQQVNEIEDENVYLISWKNVFKKC